MRAEIEIEADGRTVRLAMPIGGLEMVAEVNPALEEVRDSLHAPGPMGWRVWQLKELRAVLKAGLRYGDSQGFTDATLVEALGLEQSRAVALRLLNRAFDPGDAAPGKGEAAATQPSAAGRPAP